MNQIEYRIDGDFPCNVRESYTKVLNLAEKSISESFVDWSDADIAHSPCDVEGYFLLRAVANDRLVSKPAFVVELVGRWLKSSFMLDPEVPEDVAEMLEITGGDIKRELDLHAATKELAQRLAQVG